jgi:hypothetical protein
MKELRSDTQHRNPANLRNAMPNTKGTPYVLDIS